MRKLILSGEDRFELKHTLDLLVIETNNEANEYETKAAHMRVAEITERNPNLAESADRLPETKEETKG